MSTTVFKTAIYLMTALNFAMWIYAGYVQPSIAFTLVAGGVLAWIAVIRILTQRFGTARWVSWTALIVAMLFGVIAALALQMGLLLALHAVWTLLIIAFPIVRKNASVGSRTAKTKSPKKVAREQARLAQGAERRHAARIHREQNWREQAVNPGTMTGYEPEHLRAVSIGSPTYMYGAPGLALSQSTDAVALRLREGEGNFAKALAWNGLLDKFAVFWNVQIPEDGSVGAATSITDDVTCMVLTGKQLWLIDVKNYAQGGVTWLTDDGALVAEDDTDKGQVGERRDMGQSLSVARDRWTSKLTTLDVKTKVHAEVVLMPRPNGLGTISDVKWTGDILVSGLPALLDRLGKQPAFNPRAKHMDLLVPMLSALVKNETGVAPKPGERRKAGEPRSTEMPTAPATAPVGGQSPSASTEPGAREMCKECGAVVTAEARAAKFCEECMADL